MLKKKSVRKNMLKVKNLNFGNVLVNCSLKQLIWLVCLFITISPVLAGEAEISGILEIRTGLGANDLSDIVWDGTSIWVSGSGTLTQKLWGDGHKTTDWISYRQMEGFGRGSITALFASGGFLMVSWRFNEQRGDDLVMMGDGFSISEDNGQTWTRVTIPDLFPERAENTLYPGAYTATYDISFSKDTFWCATTSGFLLKSDDYGDTWTNILPNTTEFSFINPNHHGQCVDAYSDTVWVGTFQGMNRSTDRGQSWTNFSWPANGSGNSEDQWPGNFCVAVEHKIVSGKTHVWIGSMPYYGLGVYGICHTDDNGNTWEYKTTKYNAWNFAFGHASANNPAITDSTVFAASDSGLVVSYDLGENWEVIPIRESEDIYWEPERRVFGVLVVADTLWVTSTDGIARTENWGESWEIFRGVTRVKTLDTGARNVGVSSMFDDVKTYAFPNPFSPKRQNQDFSWSRIQYALTNDAKVTVSIYDYSGKMIRELVSEEFRFGGRDYQELWDGRDGNNDIVPNGVYFYIIRTNKGDSARGKIMVID